MGRAMATTRILVPRVDRDSINFLRASLRLCGKDFKVRLIYRKDTKGTLKLKWTLFQKT
jgi:hypothetical protein